MKTTQEKETGGGKPHPPGGTAELWILAYPVIVATLSQSLMGVVDTFFIANLHPAVIPALQGIHQVEKVEALGVKRIIYTDIDTDGMLAGPSIDGTRSICEAVSMEVTASGGVTTLDDIRSLRMLEPDGVTGCIIGRALYSGTVDLREAIAAARAY